MRARGRCTKVGSFLDNVHRTPTDTSALAVRLSRADNRAGPRSESRTRARCERVLALLAGRAVRESFSEVLRRQKAAERRRRRRSALVPDIRVV